MKTIEDKYIQTRLPVVYNGVLCDINGYGEGKTIHLKVIRDEDKNECPHCHKPIDTEISILEHSPNFQNGIELLKKQ